MRALSLPIAVLAISSAACSGGVYTRSGPPATPASAPAVMPASAAVSISAEQAAAIRAYYGTAPGRGRGRAGGLPPGIARNLARGKPLPPGIAKQYLPAELIVRLPRLGSGLEYVVVAGKLLLVEAATQVVREVLLDAVFG
jgi:hypothetical protein